MVLYHISANVCELNSAGILVPPDQDLLGGPVELEDMRLLEYKAPGPPVWTG